MIHKPIFIKNLSLSFPHKVCFSDFSATIPYGSKIALIGRNGTGKSTMLSMLAQEVPVYDGSITIPDDVAIGYVPQIIHEHDTQSGGERFNTLLTRALSNQPNLLLLDEPTNHLDRRNRTHLMRMLRTYQGTLIVVTHDPEFIKNCIDIIWHIDNQKITQFSGSYDDYMHTMQMQRSSIEQQLVQLGHQKKEIHKKVMQEQQRASKSKAHGEKKYAHDTIALRSAQGRGEKTHNKKRKMLHDNKQELLDQLAQLQLPETIVPTFHIKPGAMMQRTVVSVHEGAVGYIKDNPIVSRISFIIQLHSRIALCGDNGSGKSTIIKALLHDASVYTTGNWQLPSPETIGYLDQQYSTLEPQETVLSALQQIVPHWSHAELRRHLNDFLFRKNEEVATQVKYLSGGEKARLSLAIIAAKMPSLLILDEVTNNIDLETRNHIVEVLQLYPGALLVISHDALFLQEIGIQEYYAIQDGILNVKK